MAVSQNSKILASDISGAIKTITRSGTTFTYTTVSGGTGTFTQQDNNTTYSAGTGLSLSSNKFSLATCVTAGNAGPTANATPAFGATFTVPYITYDAYGRITGRTNRTVKIPAAPSGGTATALSSSSICYCHAVYKANWAELGSSGSCLYYNGTVSGSYGQDKYFTLPSGGTWFLYYADGGGSTVAGGTKMHVAWTTGTGDTEYEHELVFLGIKIA